MSSVSSGRGDADHLAARRAGLVSGPSRLKAVGTPSALRASTACRIAGWKVGAKQNAMPDLAGRALHHGAAAR